jgi:hypothetical protein
MMKTFLVFSLLLNLLMLAFVFSNQGQSVPEYLIKESQLIRPGVNIESLYSVFGEPMYKSIGEDSSGIAWYESNFDLEMSANEHCFVFTPKARGVSNVVIVVITDAVETIKYFCFRST